MIGHKLGEFSHTRKEFSFRQTKNKYVLCFLGSDPRRYRRWRCLEG